MSYDSNRIIKGRCDMTDISKQDWEKFKLEGQVFSRMYQFVSALQKRPSGTVKT